MTIKAAHYDATERVLMTDPVLQGMAQEIRDSVAGGSRISDEDLESWFFIRQTLEEYRRRGGEHQTHIGGPAAAIRRLLKGTA